MNKHQTLIIHLNHLAVALLVTNAEICFQWLQTQSLAVIELKVRSNHQITYSV